MKTTEKKVRVGKVKKDKSGEDWIVPVYVDGKFNDDLTYYAGSGKSGKEDAEGTRDKMIKDFKASKEYELEESNKKENSIILEQDVVINQKGKKIILEKGDRIKVLSKEKINEQEDYDVNELVKMIDYTWLIKYFNGLGIPVKNIKAEVYKNYIKADAGTFFGRELGIFRYALKEANLRVFNVGLSEDVHGHLTLWQSWTLECTTLDGGTNGFSFIDTWYDFVTNTWQTRMKGR